MSLLEILQKRRSVRRYTEHSLDPELLKQIIAAGLLSASSRSLRPWELIVVQDKAMLERLADCRAGGAAKMLAGAQAAIVVIADSDRADTWIEDASIVMANMHLMADSLGVGSCWIQGRLRQAPTGESTESYVQRLLGFPGGYQLEAILSLGLPDGHPPRVELSELAWDKVHQERF